eukprot:10604924-Alexandrium_andersonii.AAC.1
MLLQALYILLETARSSARQSKNNRPKVPESARNCSEQFWAVSAALEAALRISCYCQRPYSP